MLIYIVNENRKLCPIEKDQISELIDSHSIFLYMVEPKEDSEDLEEKYPECNILTKDIYSYEVMRCRNDETRKKWNDEQKYPSKYFKNLDDAIEMALIPF